MIDVVLHPGRERSVLRRHPWILSGAVDRVEGAAAPGAEVRVRAAGGDVLGHGHLSPGSKIRVRLFSLGKEPPAPDWIEARIARAVARRAGSPLIEPTDALRLVNSEGDDLPGLLVDVYAGTLVVKFTSAGMAARRDLVASALRETTGAAAGFERSDAVAARREGFPPSQGPLWGEAPTAPVLIRERERRYRVDLAAGQKTGFYLDQRDARDLVESVAKGRRVLDLFCYTGGFAVAAARGGAARVTGVDSSAAALECARENLALNAPGFAAELVRQDAFEYVRRAGADFDLLVIDPPPLARSLRDVDRACRAYKDVLLHALRRAAPGALLLSFSCSHHVGSDLFRKVAFAASLDAGRPARVLRSLGAAADHPVSLDHPEGAYLTGLLLEA